MKLLTCEKCGAGDFFEQKGFRICSFCRSKYSLNVGDTIPQSSHISLDNDIKMLLQKCRDNPSNARKYASLILDIDPNNSEAKKYL